MSNCNPPKPADETPTYETTVAEFTRDKSPQYGYIACSLMYHFTTNYLFSLVYDYLNMYDQHVLVKFGFGYLLMNVQYTLISEIIDWTASSVFTNIPYLNSSKRPQSKRPDRVEGYSIYFKRWSVPLFMFTTLWFNEIVRNETPIHNIAAWMDSWSTGTGTANNNTVCPADDYTMFNLNTMSRSNNTSSFYSDRNIVLYSLYYLRLAVMIQVSLAFADILYGAWHHTQHTYKWLYYKTNHQYHHQFRYPLAREATWLGFIDLWVSSIMIGRWNILLMAIILGVDLTPFELLMCISYVHEMNCSDHCGKVMPYHNSVPLLPFLEQPLGLGNAVEAHEAHHNLNTRSYGLLGVYDRIMGTTRLATVSG